MCCYGIDSGVVAVVSGRTSPRRRPIRRYEQAPTAHYKTVKIRDWRRRICGCFKPAHEVLPLEVAKTLECTIGLKAHLEDDHDHPPVMRWRRLFNSDGDILADAVLRRSRTGYSRASLSIKKAVSARVGRALSSYQFYSCGLEVALVKPKLHPAAPGAAQSPPLTCADAVPPEYCEH
jgi:hypothetical protein